MNTISLSLSCDAWLFFRQIGYTRSGFESSSLRPFFRYYKGVARRVLGCSWPHVLQAFFNQTTYNIRNMSHKAETRRGGRHYNLVSTLTLTQCDPPPPLWKILATPLRYCLRSIAKLRKNSEKTTDSEVHVYVNLRKRRGIEHPVTILANNVIKLPQWIDRQV